MDVRDIVELVNLVSGRDISELEIERKGFRLRIVRMPAAVAPGSETKAARPALAAAGVERYESPQAATPTPATAVAEDLFVMKAPIVGTFYRSPSPTAEPYARPGDRVKKGQVLCIIEAMKLMNEIESEVSGVVAEVEVEDGQPVEYGQPLFAIRTEG